MLLIHSAPGFSKQGESLNRVIEDVQNKYERMDNFHAAFIQEDKVKALNKVRKAEGKVWLKKPGMMRWSYYAPTKDEIVSDGKTLWFYDEEEKQVTESPLTQSSGNQTTATLLSGLGNIKELFNASFTDLDSLNKNESYLIDLAPKNQEEGYSKATIAVDKKTALVNTIYLYDLFGNLTIIKLKEMQIGKKVADSLFQFKAPKGVKTIKFPSVISQ